jgi:uncharacterized protein involved in type VI secretion and phage assembly
VTEETLLDRPDQTDTREKVYGKYRGIVVDSTDRLGLGRLKATVPEVLAAIPTGWAWPCVPYAGPGAGFFSVPLPGSGVWIEFEGGDVSRPIWSGCFWGTGEVPVPPPAGVAGQQTTKIWRSDLGLCAVLDDATQTMTLSDATGQNKIEVSVATGTITVKGVARIVLDGQVVQIGSGQARHPAVFGDNLLRYLGQLVTLFNTHVHPGELAGGFLLVTPAPPVSQFPPPPPSLISKKVFAE